MAGPHSLRHEHIVHILASCATLPVLLAYPALAMRLPFLSVLLTLFSSTKADVTIYGVFGKTTTVPVPSGADIPTTTTSYVTTNGPARFTSLAAYNDVYLLPPPIPSPAPATAFTINVPNSASNVVGLSIPQAGTFFGFSIEMSVATQLSQSFFIDTTSEDR